MRPWLNSSTPNRRYALPVDSQRRTGWSTLGTFSLNSGSATLAMPMKSSMRSSISHGESMPMTLASNANEAPNTSRVVTSQAILTDKGEGLGGVRR